MQRVVILISVLSLGVFTAGCPSTTCGPGTHRENNVCVPDSDALTCGPGTHQDGARCVADGSSGTDGGTSTDGGTTDGGTGLSCGPGTHQEGAQCLVGDPIDTIEVTPASATVRVNQTVKLTAVAKLKGAVVSGVTITWLSKSPAIATVDASGTAAGVAVGTTELTASARGITSAPAAITVEAGPPFRITSLQPTSGPSGAKITLTGTQLGLTQGATVVKFGGTTAPAVLSWSNTEVVVRVPVGLSPGALNVTLADATGQSNPSPFTVTATPYVNSLSPQTAVQSSKVTLFLTGTNLGACPVSINRSGSPDPDITVDNAGKIVDRAGAPGLPDLLHVNVDVGASAALGYLTVSCGASTTDPTGDNDFVITPRSGVILAAVGSGSSGLSGDGFGVATAKLNGPTALALGNSGELYIADTGNNRIRVANLSSTPLVVAGLTLPAGTLATLAGGAGLAGDIVAGSTGDGGPATQARLSAPSGLAYDARGLLFIADTGNNTVRAINVGATAVALPGGSLAPGNIALVAGAGGAAGYAGDGGPALPNSRFNGPMAVAVDGAGLVYVADTGNNRLRVINTGASAAARGFGSVAPGDVELVAGSSAAGAGGDQNPASSTTQLNAPGGLAYDASGFLFIADTGNNKLRAINTTLAALVLNGPSSGAGGAGVSIAAGNIDTLAGTGGAGGFTGDGGSCGSSSPYPGGGAYHSPAACSPQAKLSAPVGLTVGPFRQLFVADQNNSRVRLAVAGDSPVFRAGKWFFSGGIDTLAGNGTTSAGVGAGDTGPATSAGLFGPLGVAYSAADASLYIADTLHNRIRRVVVDTMHGLFSGEQGAWPADFTTGTATLNVDTGILSYSNGNGPAERRFGVTNGVFSFQGPLRLYANTTLNLTGSQPAGITATGDVQIDGTINVNNGGITGGPSLNGEGGPGHGAQGPTGYTCNEYYDVWYGGAAYGNAGLRPLTAGSGGEAIGGALLLSAGTPGATANLKLTGVIHADSGSTSSCTPIGGSGGGVRLVATGQVSVTGTITAVAGARQPVVGGYLCCGKAYAPAFGGSPGRIRLEAPTVTATGTLNPAASIATQAPAPLPWM